MFIGFYIGAMNRPNCANYTSIIWGIVYIAIGIKIIKHKAGITGKSLAGGSYHFQFKFITGIRVWVTYSHDYTPALLSYT